MSSSARTPSKRWDHGQRRKVLVESLLKEIVNGKIRSGEHLVTQSLARRFGVSHTPIREALVMLAGMGLVDATPNRGAVVRRVTGREVREICQVRRALECEAIRLACGRIEGDELERLKGDLERLLSSAGSIDQHRLISEARSVDSKLHDLVAVRSGNAFLVHELGRLKTLFRAFRDVAWDHSESHRDYHRLDDEAREHLTIVEALIAGDRPRAVRSMAGHIVSGMTYWCSTLPDRPVPQEPDRAGARAGIEGNDR
ncbi:MAG: GntR family transcriptional regulator [Isosphaeraceae bacterium]